jgi:hypothetical protein
MTATRCLANAATLVATLAAAGLVAAIACAPGLASAHDRDEGRDVAGHGQLEPGYLPQRPVGVRAWPGDADLGRGREREGWREERGRWVRVEAREHQRLERIREVRAELRELDRERWEVQARSPRRAWRLARLDEAQAPRRAELERELCWLTESTPHWLAGR